MALRPTMMLLASCWALLAISQDAIGVPTGSERIATSQFDNHDLICKRDGLDDLCRFPSRPDMQTSQPGVRVAILTDSAEVRSTSVVKPKPRPKDLSTGRKASHSKASTKQVANVIDTDDSNDGYSKIVAVARKYVGLSERSDRSTLASFFADRLDQDIDPVRTPWCAAFINAVLAEAGLPTSGSNQGISFASYGTKVSKPKVGDIVVIRGGRSSRTHVGIYVGAEKRGNKTYIKLLGGNQSNHVQVSSYDSRKIIAIRRPG